MEEIKQANIIETALNAAAAPQVVQMPNGSQGIFMPKGEGNWGLHITDEHNPNPVRKIASPTFDDANSFIRYVNRHREDGTVIFIDADFKAGKIHAEGVLDYHTANTPHFAEHTANYAPKPTPHASEWVRNNNERMNQMNFAAFLTGHSRQIVSKNPNDPNKAYPTAAEVLDFALNLEYTEKTTFKQGYREQDGRINFTFQSEDAGQTETNLKAFERFGLAITPYYGSDAYFVEALLKFRIDKNSGALVLWYELQNFDAVTEQSAQDIAAKFESELQGIDIYYGRR